MQEEKQTIKLTGRIEWIIKPAKGNFAFVEGETFVCFNMVTTEGKKLFAKGLSFPVYNNQEIILEGYYEKDNKTKKEVFCFTSLFGDYIINKKSFDYVRFIIGQKNYETLYKSIKKKYNLVGNDVKKKILSTAIDALDNNDEEYFKKYVLVKNDKVIQQFFKKHNLNKKFKPACDKLSKYGLNQREVTIMILKGIQIDDVVATIERNPYQLIYNAKISFRRADKIFADCGGKPNSKNRVIASIFEALKVGYDSEGNVFLTKEQLLANTYKLLEENYFKTHETVDEKELSNMISKLIQNNFLVYEKARYYLPENYDVQNYLKDFCSKALKNAPYNYDVDEFISKYEDEHGFKLGKEQKQSVYNAVNNKVHIITGGAGVGKTSSLACILAYFLDVLGYKEEEIALCAPTGKASQRMTESVNKQIGMNHKQMIATTVHILLEPTGDLDDFYYNAKNKLNQKIIVVDETSMLDYKIAYSLLSAIRDDARILFLGDIEQLEPVGAGFFFRDIIESQVSTSYLTEIHRQKGESTIISLSQAIRNERFNDNNLDRKNDFAMIQINSNTPFDYKIKKIVDCFMISVKKAGLDQTMIITPLRETQENNKIDSKTLSIAIQERLLPDKEDEYFVERNGFKFKVGSKIICTKNNYKKGLINGEIGYITDIDKDSQVITCEFDGEEKVLDSSDINEIRLGYAITVHKSQGSEWKNVIYCCFSDTSMNKKNLVYTAVTRAKEKLVIIGEKEIVAKSPLYKSKRKNSVLLNE